ncbi:MAG: dicarboxylate/amino acid:cation symporter [Defluviitaleaceae bacterium]|nr:dicarboxylate/amino acid:cation symporter [Defluviitaleaceae bacterium]
MSNFFKSLPFKLLVAIGIGLLIGLNASEGVIDVVMSIRHISSQIVMFCVPLITIGAVAPSIARMGKNASKLLGFSLVLAYASAAAAAVFAITAAFSIIPLFTIADEVEALRSLPSMTFELNIPPIMATMSALVLALMIGLSVVWTESKNFANLLEEFYNMVMMIVRKVIIPILPIFIGATFAVLAYDGRFTHRLPVFLPVILLIIALHFTWIGILYIIAAAYTKKKPIDVIRHYGPAWFTAAGTMSSAATLPVALRCASNSKILDKNMVNFGIPLFSYIHMPGSVISILTLSSAVSLVLYGQLPELGTMLLFASLVCVFAVAAPGVPGGVLMASMGLITAILGFGEDGTALMLAIFALQDSFGTACNISSDGPQIMVLSKYAGKHGIGDTSGSIF